MVSGLGRFATKPAFGDRLDVVSKMFRPGDQRCSDHDGCPTPRALALNLSQPSKGSCLVLIEDVQAMTEANRRPLSFTPHISTESLLPPDAVRRCATVSGSDGRTEDVVRAGPKMLDAVD